MYGVRPSTASSPSMAAAASPLVRRAGGRAMFARAASTADRRPSERDPNASVAANAPAAPDHAKNARRDALSSPGVAIVSIVPSFGTARPSRATRSRMHSVAMPASTAMTDAATTTTSDANGSRRPHTRPTSPNAPNPTGATHGRSSDSRPNHAP